ncbi:MAG TPA: hypothetical protein VLR26_02615 [Frankiaceae bacterium]|nr:hypothetical protein [Frankiaceae bacterium]
MTRRKLSDQWSVELDDTFTGRLVDGDLQLVSPGPPVRTIWLALWYPPIEHDPEKLLDWVLAEVNPNPVERFEEVGADEGELRYASWYPEEVDGRAQWALYGYVVRRGFYVQAAFFCDRPEDKDWAVATWRSLRFSPVAAIDPAAGRG